MSQKQKGNEADYVSFEKDLTNKMQEKIMDKEAKFRIKLCAMLYHHKQKQNLDKELHTELLKLKRNYEKKTFDIVKQVNNVVKSDGYINLSERIANTKIEIFKDVNFNEQVYYPKIPQYWWNCLKNCPLLMQIKSSKDSDIAKSIQTIDITREDSKQQKSFTLSFQLLEDQKFFTNPSIQVTFYLIDSVNPYRLESNAEFKQKSNKETSSTGIFMQLFQNINLEDGLNKLQKIFISNKASEARGVCTQLGKSYEIALIFKDELIPYSLEYYVNARDPQLKKELQEKQMVEKLNERRNKYKGKTIQDQEEEELFDQKYIEENDCKQQ